MKNNITFVGFDVHATSLALAVLPPGAKVPVERKIPNGPKVIRSTFTLRHPAPGRHPHSDAERGP